MKMIQDPFIQLMTALCVVVFFTVAWVTSSPKTVSLSAKHWQCTAAEPNGIETRCVNYSYVSEKGRN